MSENKNTVPNNENVEEGNVGNASAEKTENVNMPKKKKKHPKYSYSLQKTKTVLCSDDQDHNAKEKELFPAAKLLLESAKDEYTKERERTHYLDNKASFFMTTVILVVTVFIPIIPFNRFVTFAQEAEGCKLSCVFLAFYCCCY